MIKPNLLDARLTRCLILVLGISVTSAAVPIPELAVRPALAVPTTEQQLAQLQQQVQSLQAQLAALQAIVQITPASTAGQEPTVTIAAGAVRLRATNTMQLMSGANLDMRSSAEVVIRAASVFHLDGADVRFNGGTKRLATVGSVVQTGSPTGVLSGQIMNGSPNVFSN